MAVPYTFATATSSIPLSQLDSNFSTAITLGNTAIQLGNTVTTLNNMTLANATVSSGNVTATTVTATTVTSPAATALTIQSAGTTAMTVDTSQNVGIGTSSPAYKLDVNGGINSQTGFVYLGNANVYANYRSGNNDVIYSGASGFFYYQNITSTYHAWYTGNSEHARIDSSGNLLVGTTTSSARLTVQADSSSVQPVVFNSTAAGTGATSLVRFRRNGTNVGEIEITGSATTYATSSDYRLKHDIAPMTGALAKVAALKPVTYKWNADDSNGEGFIAHELAEVCPGAVTGEKDAVDAEGNIVPQGIDTSFLVATLTAAIQEQQAMIESLTARIAALEGAK